MLTNKYIIKADNCSKVRNEGASSSEKNEYMVTKTKMCKVKANSNLFYNMHLDDARKVPAICLAALV